MADTPLTDAELKAQYGNLAGTQPAPVVPANPLLDAYKPDATQVFSQANIQSTTQTPLAPPNYSDPMGYLDRIKQESGFTEAQKQFNDATAALRQFDQGSLAQQNQLEDTLNPMGVITGSQASQERLRSQSRSSLASKAQVLQDYLTSKADEVNQKYQIFNDTKSTMQNLILNNPGAKIKFTDSIDTASKKLVDYSAQAKKDAYKDALNGKLIDIGLSGKGKNTKEMEKLLAKHNKELLAEAKQERDLKIQGLQADIANTKSLIGERGKDNTKPVTLDLSNAGLSKLIQEEVNSGADWGTIATKLEAAQPGITRNGSPADQYLRYSFGVTNTDPFTGKKRK